jgi:hypothetical protein
MRPGKCLLQNADKNSATDYVGEDQAMYTPSPRRALLAIEEKAKDG